ncbi:MAG: ATP phosphoribosyltransferase regulatory subunit [Coriobacteriia bacterium]|nr:ATP phosphoribosyltransferase regulatory subunit [Coriobacteriia bacterium]
MSTPRGFRDVLPTEALEREGLARAVSSVMSAWGYGPVETPVVELDSTVAAGLRAPGSARSFRLIDSDGKLLCLRPDMTMPIARLVATRLAGDPGPHRLRYAADVFREKPSLGGQSREFTQSGLELIGVGGACGDAEVVAVLVESLLAAGLDEFVVTMGTVAVLTGLIRAAKMPGDWSGDVLAAAHDRNLVALDALAGRPDVPAEVGAGLRAVPRIRGGRRAIDEARALVSSLGVGEALDQLEETWGLLESAGVSDYVSVDLGVMRSFGYYTGMVLEVYVAGLGLPLGGGGRYDSLLGEFGCEMPAAGFALSVERLHVALAQQDANSGEVLVDAVVGGAATEAFSAARRLRDAGRSVVIVSDTADAEILEQACRWGAEPLRAEAGSTVSLADPLPGRGEAGTDARR